ncbi:hypothetical protein ACHAXR_012009 [Thalassiosira sp. AJA248-18]
MILVSLDGMLTNHYQAPTFLILQSKLKTVCSQQEPTKNQSIYTNTSHPIQLTLRA